MTKRTRASNAPVLPADSQPDRHTLLTSASAAAALIASTAPAALAAAAAAPADPDAALWVLREEWLRKRQIFEETMKRRTIVEARVFARSPRYPELVHWRGTLADFNAKVARIRVEREAIEREEGVPAMEEADCQAIAADAEVVDRIADVPAQTVAGLCFKAHVSEDWGHDHSELAQSIILDLAAFAAAHPTLAL